MLKISIITPTYNSANTLSKTIDSVLLQKYPNMEYIVIDGNSSDGTQDLVLSYKNKMNLKIISEKDDGIFYAMNKGIKIATGDIIGILNSDDFYDDDHVLSSVIECFKEKNIDAVYGDISYFSCNINNITRYWKAGEYKESNLYNGWIIPHPALFLRKSVYEQCGLFNTDFQIAADYEFILRILKVYKIKVKYVPKIFVRMYNSGNSASSLKQRTKGWEELKKSWLVNNFKVPHFFILRRLLYKIMQFYKR